MVHKVIYLAGPISGLTSKEATEWRHAVKEQLEPLDIKCLSPLRANVHLRNSEGLLDANDNLSDTQESLDSGCQILAMSTQRGVVERDKFDCINANMILVNLLGAKKVSIGTMIEIGWANANGIPIVLVIEDDKSNCHEHAFVRECAAFRTNSILEGTKIIAAMLGAY